MHRVCVLRAVSHMINGVNLVAETQNARVAYLTVFTVISLGLLSVAQVYYLRRFFQVSSSPLSLSLHAAARGADLFSDLCRVWPLEVIF